MSRSQILSCFLWTKVSRNHLAARGDLRSFGRCLSTDAKFPRNFKAQVKVIYKRLFRLYAHIYYHHLENLKSIGANAHLNTCFKHFIYFCYKFDLLDDQETLPLKKLINKFISG